MVEYKIGRKISESVLMISVSYKIKGPSGGGVSSLIMTYSNYFYKLRHIASWWPFKYKFLKGLFTFFALVKFVCLLIFDKRIKIVHIHTAAWASFERKGIFALVAKKFNKTVFLHIHAADFKPYFDGNKNKKLIKRILNTADIIIVLSQFWKKYFEELGISGVKIRVLNNIVPKPNVRSEKIHIGLIKFLFLGELSSRKGIFDLLSVIISNKKKFRGIAKFRIAGNGNETKISTLIKNNNIGDIVNLEGWVAGQKKLDLLNWTDIFVLPSYNEGLPIAILENMSFEHPIISTNVGGIPEIIRNNENGLLINPGDLDSMEKAIQFFIDQPLKIIEFGNRSREIVENFFPEKVIKQLKELYKEFLN